MRESYVSEEIFPALFCSDKAEVSAVMEDSVTEADCANKSRVGMFDKFFVS